MKEEAGFNNCKGVLSVTRKSIVMTEISIVRTNYDNNKTLSKVNIQPVKAYQIQIPMPEKYTFFNLNIQLAKQLCNESYRKMLYLL